MKETILQNIDLSSEVIVFDQQTKQGQLTIVNKHNSLGAIFKIKATKLNIIDVKPAKGFIKPQGKIVINFKLSPNISEKEMQTIENNDKFLIQLLNIPNHEASREQIEDFWKAYKNNTANLQYGYGCYRVFMNLTGRKRFAASNIKSDATNSKFYKSVSSSRNEEQQSRLKSQKDEQLSKKYSQLKTQQQELQQKRQKIFKSTATPVKSTSGKGGKIKSVLVFLILFILAFLSGNYIRSTMIKVKIHQEQKQQKGSFFKLPFFN